MNSDSGNYNKVLDEETLFHQGKLDMAVNSYITHTLTHYRNGFLTAVPGRD